MRAYLELMGKTGNLRSELNSAKGAVSHFGSAVKGEFSALRGMAGSLTGQLAALGVSFSALKVAAGSARLDKDLTSIKQLAGATAGDVANLRRELFSMARQTGKPLEELQGGFDDLIKQGLNWQEALEAIKAVNIGSTATSSQITTLNKAIREAGKEFNFDLTKPGQALELLNKMQTAADKGTVPLEDMAAIFGQLGRSGITAGLSMDKTLATISAFSQAETNPEQLAALTGRAMRVFSSRRYMKYAQEATKVRFFDKKGERRDAFDVMADLKKKYDSLQTDRKKTAFLQRTFGKADENSEQALKKLFEGDALSKMASITKEIGNSGDTLSGKVAEATDNAVDQVGKLKADLREAADGFAAPINATLNDMIKRARDSKDKGGLGLDGKDMLAWGAGGVAATALLGRYGGKMAGRIFSGPGNLAEGVVKGKALQEMAGVTPVFVVNMPDGGILGGITPPTGATGAAGAATKTVGAVGKVASAAGKAVAVGGAFLAGYEAGGYINQGLGWISGKMSGDKYSGKGWLGNRIYDWIHPEKTEEQNKDKAPGVAIKPGGALFAAAARSQKMDDIRARIGGGDDRLNNMRYDWLHPEKPEVKNDIKIEVAIDQDGRVIASTNDPNTKIEASKKRRRGSFYTSEMD
jgi:hypothetical protein